LVTAYNLGFGDTVLITIPELESNQETVRHILVDFGNVLGKFNDDVLYRAVAQDIQRRLAGRPLDLYVMTHEHMDHVRGLLYANKLNLRLPVDFSWITASADPTYGERYAEAWRREEQRRQEFKRLQAAISANSALSACAPLQAFLAINDPFKTADCVTFIREAAAKRTSFVHREFPLSGAYHPLREAQLTIWAPEANTAAYYGRVRPLPRQSIDALMGKPSTLTAPEGVDPAAFRKLLQFLESGVSDSLLAIDRAANNTSVVFLLEWRGWRLLFPGDAEIRSWAFMDRCRLLRPIHFLKVSHHASRNGTPPEALLEQLFPGERADDRPRTALFSTAPNVYSGVPDSFTEERIKVRVDNWVDTQSAPLGGYAEVAFEG
jgi:beta-lactamase superfamily II metal-dependent hydrolase